MDYEAARRIRHMCEQIARTLGEENPPDITDDSVSWTYTDNRVRIYDSGFWVDLSMKNKAGLFARALTVGGMTCKGDDSLFLYGFYHLHSLYADALFYQSTKSLKRFRHVQYISTPRNPTGRRNSA